MAGDVINEKTGSKDTEFRCQASTLSIRNDDVLNLGS